MTLKQNCFKGINVRYQTGMENIQLAETQNKWDHVSKTQHAIKCNRSVSCNLCY